MSLSSLKTRWDTSRWLWSMGASTKDSLELLASYNSRVVRRRLGLRGVAPMTARLRTEGAELPFRFCAASDFTVLWEVFQQRQYELPVGLSPKTILDLGANTGLSALFFRARFPNATIYAVEAHPATYALLEHNAALWSNVRPVHVAASGSNGRVEFYGTPDESISSSVFRRRDTDSKIEVQGENLSALLARCGGFIDLLKFDIEGAEFELFSNFNEWERIGVMIGEVHPDLYRGTPEQFFALFPRHSHQIVASFGTRLVVRFDPKAPASP
jgi:FkbM family methyltransferase